MKRTSSASKSNLALNKSLFYVKEKIYYRIVEFYGIGSKTLLMLDFYKNKKWIRKKLMIDSIEFRKQFKKTKK